MRNALVKIIAAAVTAIGLSTHTQATGVIGKATEGGKPVIYAFESELPNFNVQEQLKVLTVISWKYDGDDNNGMPLPSENERMIALEDALIDKLDGSQNTYHAYSRTGNNLKEFSYYVQSKDQFMTQPQLK